MEDRLARIESLLMQINAAVAGLQAWQASVERRLARIEQALGNQNRRSGNGERLDKILGWVWRFLIAGAVIALAVRPEILANLLK